MRKEKLTSFRYIRRNMKKVTLIKSWEGRFKHRQYKVELRSGSVVYVQVDRVISAFTLGCLVYSSIIDENGEKIVDGLNFPLMILEIPSMRLGEKLYYNYRKWCGIFYSAFFFYAKISPIFSFKKFCNAGNSFKSG